MINPSELTQKDVTKAIEIIKWKYPDCGSNGLTKKLGGDIDSLIDNDFFLKQVRTALIWINEAIIFCGTTKRPRQNGSSSYFIKHQIEEFGQRNGHSSYICNMAAIVAFEIDERISYMTQRNSPNPYTNLKI